MPSLRAFQKNAYDEYYVNNIIASLSRLRQHPYRILKNTVGTLESANEAPKAISPCP